MQKTLARLGRMKSVKQAVPHVHESPVRSLIGGLKCVRGNQTVLMLLVIAFLLNLFASPYR